MSLREALTGWWAWPDGMAWQAALGVGGRLRRQRFEAFMRCMQPGPETRVLDVGVTAGEEGSSNCLERLYPWPERLTACGIEVCPDVCRERGIRYMHADAMDLPFARGEFDIVHCNAVVEHVGSRVRQRRLVEELTRVGRTGWLATPDASGPLEPHTLVPFVHWFPRVIRARIYRLAGRAQFADERQLNLLDVGSLLRCFPRSLAGNVRIDRQYWMGLPVILMAMWAEETFS